MSIRIGINALYLIPGGVGGTEIYLRSLLAALAAIDQTNQYFVYMNRETGDDLTPSSPRFHPVRCGVRARFRPFRIVYEQTVLPCLLARDQIEVVFNPGYTAPLFTPCPSVTVFHDLQHKRHPEFFRRFDLPFWNLLLWVSARRSDRLIAVSRATAMDLARYLPGLSKKITVIPHGVDNRFLQIGEHLRQHADEPCPYLLTVATLHPHKNLERLLEAFQSFHVNHKNYRLIVAGMRGFATESIEARASELRLGESVVFTGWIPRAKLYSLFEGASAFISPSLFEGFGLPVIEALAAGLPTACSAIPVFESLTGDAALHFDPRSIPAITAALERITMDSAFRARATTAGPERAREFDWRRTAELTLQELLGAAGIIGEDRQNIEKIARQQSAR